MSGTPQIENRTSGPITDDLIIETGSQLTGKRLGRLGVAGQGAGAQGQNRGNLATINSRDLNDEESVGAN